MIRYLSLFASLMIFMSASGQIKYEPQILILAPNVITHDKVLEHQISTHNQEIREAQKAGKIRLLAEDTTDQPENIKLMLQNEKAFLKMLDFYKLVSFIAEQHLSYVFFERFPNLKIILKDIKCGGNIADLRKIALQQQLQYVLNFPMINFYSDAGVSKAKISVQLYDQKANSLVINRAFTGDWNNPGFEFTCRDSSLMCTINNALAQALSEVVGIVVSNSPTLQNEKLQAQQRDDLEEKLFQPRYDVLIGKYYSKPFDSVFIHRIISPLDSSINNKVLYYGLTDNTKTKFVAFYLEENQNPRMYGYIVKGVAFKDKWYYKRSELTYFDTKDTAIARKQLFNTLQQQEWGFFKEGSLAINPGFWETNQFENIKDLKKNADWEKYKEMWENEERENRDYVGVYEFVAEELKKKRKEENEKFDSLTGATIFLPFYEAQIKTNPTHFAEYTLWNKKPTLIFPKNKKFALNPIAVTDSAGQKKLHFYFTFAGSNIVYEWTYFQPIPIRRYSGEIVDQMGTVTKWNFAYTTLDDNQFWENYVLVKSGREYKYLKRIQ